MDEAERPAWVGWGGLPVAMEPLAKEVREVMLFPALAAGVAGVE
jgi:hypothetical protein